KDIDVAYVPIGMGSGICSAVAVRNGLKLKTKLIGVVSAHATSYADSFEKGSVVESPVSTRIADGVACRRADAEQLAILLDNVDHLVRVTDDEVEAAMRHYFTDTHNVVEGAGAASLAAAIQEKEQLQGKRVAVIATGANVDRDVFARVLKNETV
ncbi:MAG TPA: pyridoxal-phosphate dependent enzyme, partial [Candidatus Acidoferrum sp.]|nr:pyridoxal-phosphate dependent enzyme [Candidatus Acidoferrum sp.]